MSEYYFHYTSTQGAQDIIATGSLSPGKDGQVYLTKDLYSSGAEAINWLAITGKPIEMICAIQRESMDQVTQPELIEGVDSEGSQYRSGGGWQVTTPTPVRASDIIWMAVLPP